MPTLVSHGDHDAEIPIDVGGVTLFNAAFDVSHR